MALRQRQEWRVEPRPQELRGWLRTERVQEPGNLGVFMALDCGVSQSSTLPTHTSRLWRRCRIEKLQPVMK